jgi:outer membrane protein OmpA-like peptidoglycan-associated protein
MTSHRLNVPATGAALLLAATFALPARAEERKNSLEFGFLGGSTFYASEKHLENPGHLGLRLGWNFLPAYEVEVQWVRSNDASVQSAESTLFDRSSVGLGFLAAGGTASNDSLSARFLINPGNSRRRFKPYALFGIGYSEYTLDPELPPGDEGQVDDTVFTFGGGIRMRLTPHMAFRAEFESEYALSDQFHNEHLNVGLTWVVGGGKPADTDGDGILDLSDRCPDTPKGALVDSHNGCPWDLDVDGIMEGIDKCPETPRSWPVDPAGCPLDTDGDAVPDGADKCADTPKGALVKQDGCPFDTDKDTVFDGIDRCPDTPAGGLVDPPDSPTAGCPHDSDNDEVVDGVDQCPLTPAGAWVDEKGCPKDSDGDRALDGLDPCPDSPKGDKTDREGCPRVRLDKPEAQILQNVKFVEGIELWPGTDAWLALLVEALTYWQDVGIEVGVYTDNQGSATANKNIAQRRAEVVREWLVAHGIEKRRISIRGYGSVNFVAENDTEEGRDKNRRVEVKRVSGDLRKHPAPIAEPEAEPAPEPAPASPPEPAPASPPDPAPAPAPEPAPSNPAPAGPAPSEPAPPPGA